MPRQKLVGHIQKPGERPQNVELYVQEQFKVGDIRRFAPVGDDYTVAFQATATELSDAGGGVFYVPPGKTYKVTDEVDFGAFSNLTIDARGAVFDCSSVASTNTDAIFNIGSTTEGQTTTLTSAVAKGETDIPVASSSGFAAGDMCALVSSDEYWNGVPGVSGFGRKTKGELVFIQSIPDSASVTLETAIDESYSVTGFTVSLVKLPRINDVTILGGTFIGDGGGTSHTSANPTGMRAFKIACTHNANVIGATFRNFPRAAGEFHLCSGVSALGNTLIGRKLDDPTNLPNISLWFAGMFFLGCDNVDFGHNKGFFLRRHYDPDNFTLASGAGMVIGRSHSIARNRAVACLEPIGAHSVKNATFSHNKQRGCYRGAAFRGMDVKFIGNDLGSALDDTLLSVGGATNLSYSSTESPSVGHVTLLGNSGDGTLRGVQISGDIESLNSDNNTIKCGSSAGVEIGIGYYIRSRRPRNIKIGAGDVIDLTDRVDNAVGVLIPCSGAILEMKNIDIRATVIGAYNGVQIGGGASDNEAENVHIDARIIDAENAAVALKGSAISNDEDGWFGQDVSVRVRLSGTEPTNLLEMPSAANIIRFRRRPSFEVDRAERFIGYGDETDLENGETVSDGDWMLEQSTGKRTRFSEGTIGDDGGATVTINSGQTAGTVTTGDRIAKGQYVRIAGAGVAGGNLDTTVVSKSVNDIEFEDAASTTVSGAALSFINPTTTTLTPS